MAAPAFCGVEPRVSTTEQYTQSRPCSRTFVNSASKSRMVPAHSAVPVATLLIL